jgi:hypothetical protein
MDAAGMIMVAMRKQVVAVARVFGGGKMYVRRIRNSKNQDATASIQHDDADMNSTMQIIKRKDAKARTVSRKRSNPNIFGFFVDSRYEDAIQTTKIVNLTDQPKI